MPEEKKSKPFNGYNHGVGPIPIMQGAAELRPVQVHLKEDGAIGDKPSLAIVMIGNDGVSVAFGQISVEMMNKGLADIDYTMVKKSDLIALLQNLNTDAEMALDDRWDRSDDGFIAIQQVIDDFMRKHTLTFE